MHEVIGLAAYRSGRWKQAAAELELAQQLHPNRRAAARAGRRLPGPAPLDRRRAGLGRRAGGLTGPGGARRGPHRGRRRPGRPGRPQGLRCARWAGRRQVPKRVRDHHLRQWYVLGDLHDRAGDTLEATRWFELVAGHDRDFVDVVDRLRPSAADRRQRPADDPIRTLAIARRSAATTVVTERAVQWRRSGAASARGRSTRPIAVGADGLAVGTFVHRRLPVTRAVAGRPEARRRGRPASGPRGPGCRSRTSSSTACCEVARGGVEVAADHGRDADVAADRDRSRCRPARSRRGDRRRARAAGRRTPARSVSPSAAAAATSAHAEMRNIWLSRKCTPSSPTAPRRSAGPRRGGRRRRAPEAGDLPHPQPRVGGAPSARSRRSGRRADRGPGPCRNLMPA